MPVLGAGHIWLIFLLLVIVLIIWGPGKLPDVGAGLGRAIREFKKASTEVRESVVNAAATDQRDDARPPAQPVTTSGEDRPSA